MGSVTGVALGTAMGTARIRVRRCQHNMSGCQAAVIVHDAGSLNLFAGNTSSTESDAVGGSVTVAAGTVSVADSSLISYITILGTNKFGTAGDILVFSTGTVVVQSPLLVQGPAGFSSILVDQLAVTGNSSLGSAVADALFVLGNSILGSAAADELLVTGSSSLGAASALQLTVAGSATIGSAASDVLTTNAALVARAGATVAGLFIASGNSQLGSSAGRTTLTVYATTTFAAAAGDVTFDAAITANSDLAVNGNTVTGAAAGGHTLTVNAVTTFTAAAGSITSNAAFTANRAFIANSAVVANDNLRVNGNTVLGRSAGGQTLTISAATTFTAQAGSLIANVPVFANSDLCVGGLLNASGDANIGTDSQDALTVNAASVFASLLRLSGIFLGLMVCKGQLA